MESADFGPLMSAECITDPRIEDIKAELEESRSREHELLQQKLANEASFGQQRAKFMELFRQKEEELRQAIEQLAESNKSNVTLKDQLWQQMAELDDIKTAAAVSESVKLDEIERERRMCSEEVATIQHLMKEERLQWRKEEEKLHAEIAELRARLKQDRDSFLGSLTKTLHKRMGSGLVQGTAPDEKENSEFDMKKAQEDAEMLKSVVQPLEEEIESLRNQLHQIQSQKEISSHVSVGAGQSHANDKIKELQDSFNREKSSRKDLELYVAVLNTQKNVLQDDLDKLRAQLQDVCYMLEDEKHENSVLRHLSKMAAEQILVMKSLHAADLKKIESLLTSEQMQQIADVKDSAVESCCIRLKELESLIELEEHELDKKHKLKEQNLKQTNNDSNMVNEVKDVNSSLTSDRTAPDGETVQRSCTDAVNSFHYHNLTDAQQKSLIAPTPESQASDALLTWAKMESLSAVGMRLVAESELAELHHELTAAKNALKRPCEKCVDLAAKLEQFVNECKLLDRTLQDERELTRKQQTHITQLELALSELAADTSSQILALTHKLQHSLSFVEAAKCKFQQDQQEINKQLTEFGQNMQREINRVQAENDNLVAKHSKHSQELQEELISLPDNIEEMHLLLLKYREELIAAKVAQERTSELLSGELELVRSHAISEQRHLKASVARLEESLVRERSICSELERTNTELMQSTLQPTDVRTKQAFQTLQGRLKQEQAAKNTLEQELHKLQSHMMAFNSSVTNDSAHIPSTYDWTAPHANSPVSCSKCYQQFSDNVVQVLCHRCGGVYCNNCTGKTIAVGPKHQLTDICDDCFQHLSLDT